MLTTPERLTHRNKKIIHHSANRKKIPRFLKHFKHLIIWKQPKVKQIAKKINSLRFHLPNLFLNIRNNSHSTTKHDRVTIYQLLIALIYITAHHREAKPPNPATIAKSMLQLFKSSEKIRIYSRKSLKQTCILGETHNSDTDTQGSHMNTNIHPYA